MLLDFEFANMKEILTYFFISILATEISQCVFYCRFVD